MPKPEIPTFQLLPIVAVDCIAITMVSYTITLSMALIFAQKLQYDIDSNQELFAMVTIDFYKLFSYFFFSKIGEGLHIGIGQNVIDNYVGWWLLWLQIMSLITNDYKFYLWFRNITNCNWLQMMTLITVSDDQIFVISEIRANYSLHYLIDWKN